MFVNGIVEPEVKKTKKDEKSKVTFDEFLEYCKKQDKIVIDKEKTKQGNTKIRYDNKIMFYAHSGKKASVILWNNFSKKNLKISNLEETNKLIKSVID